MPVLVLAAEAFTLLLIGIFCLLLTADGLFGPLFEIKVVDPVGHTLIRNAQIAFGAGYSGLFAFSLHEIWTAL